MRCCKSYIRSAKLGSMGQDDEEIINMMGSAEPEILDEAERKEVKV